ncbi:MAG: hypothetical protein U0610_13360 [bacterium]
MLGDAAVAFGIASLTFDDESSSTDGLASTEWAPGPPIDQEAENRLRDRIRISVRIGGGAMLEMPRLRATGSDANARDDLQARAAAGKLVTLS